MRFIINVLSVSLMVMLTVTSCSPKKTSQNFIPNKAIAIAGINVSSLEKKLLQDSVTFQTIINGLVNGNSDTSLKKAFDDYMKLKASGLNINQKLYAFIIPSKIKASQLLALVATISDRKKFEDFIISNYKSNFIQTKNGELTIFKEAKKDAGILAISNNTAIFLKSIENKGDAAIENSLEEEVVALFSLKESETIKTNKHFDELDKIEADGFVYATPSTTIPQIKKVLGFGKVNDLAKGLEAAGTFNFEMGKIDINTIVWPNDKFGAVLTKYAGPVIDISKVEKFPVKTLNGFLQVNFNPELLVDLLTEADVINEARVGGKAALKGIDPLDVQKAFGGQINVMIGDFIGANASVGDGLNSAIDGVSALAEIPVKDKLAFKKIMDALVAQKILFINPSNNTYVTPFNADPESTLGISITDEKIVLASNKSLLTNYQSGTLSPLSADVKAKVANSSTAFFADANSIITKAFPVNNEKDKIAKDIFGPILKNLFLTLGNFKEGALKGNIEVNLNETKTNALPTILKAMVNYNKAIKLIPSFPQPTLVPLGPSIN